MEKKKIGMMVAVEIDSVTGRYGSAAKKHEKYGFNIYEYELDDALLYVIHSGAGEIAAAAATQLLISEFGVRAVVNFGVVGGLTDEMKLAKTVIVERVVHYDFDASAVDGSRVGQYVGYDSEFIYLNKELIDRALALAPELKPVTCASGDKFIEGEEKKRSLAERFSADICEMELAAIALTCGRCGVPCIAIKTVSDAVTGGAESFSRMVRQAGDLCMEVTERLIPVI